jgi:hypothetical protein
VHGRKVDGSLRITHPGTTAVIALLAIGLSGGIASAAHTERPPKLETFVATYGDTRVAVNVQATAGGGGYSTSGASRPTG